MKKQETPRQQQQLDPTLQAHLNAYIQNRLFSVALSDESTPKIAKLMLGDATKAYEFLRDEILTPAQTRAAEVQIEAIIKKHKDKRKKGTEKR